MADVQSPGRARVKLLRSVGFEVGVVQVDTESLTKFGSVSSKKSM